MTLLARSDRDQLEPEALIPEARTLRRRRQAKGTVAILALGIVGLLAYGFGAGGFRSTPATRPASNSPTTGVTRTSASAVAPLGAFVGLVSPGVIQVAPDGSLLIADTGRHQLLMRTPAGHLEVVAGTGVLGNSGDGGPAVDAELGGMTSIAVAPNGSIYIAAPSCPGPFSCSGSIRVIDPAGDIRTLSTQIYATSLVVSPSGTLYAGGFGFVASVGASGRPTLILGQADYVPGFGRLAPSRFTTAIGNVPNNFDVTAMAFDGSGNLDLYSNPDFYQFLHGTLREIGPSGTYGSSIEGDAAEFATAPNGDVYFISNVLPSRGPTLERIAGTTFEPVRSLRRAPIPGYSDGLTASLGTPVTSSPQDFEPSGLAAGPDGTIYLDTNSRPFGLADGAAIAEVSSSGTARLLPITGRADQSFPALDASGFPLSVYPAPTTARPGDGSATCPSLSGVEPFNMGTTASAEGMVAAAFQDQTGGGAGNDYRQLLVDSDRAWWPEIYGGFGVHPIVGSFEVESAVPLASLGHVGTSITAACGRQLVEDSLLFTVDSTEAAGYESGHVVVLNRAGTPLIYYQYG